MYSRPTKLSDALKRLAAENCAILAGGTDFYPARVGRPITENILDVSLLDDLRGVRALKAGWRVGALTTWSDLLAAPLPPLFDGLKLAAREVGGVQIQNTGTVAGNLCNASPAADGVPALLALDAKVELSSQAGKRVVELGDFIVGNRQTTRQPHELLTAVLIPAWKPDTRTTFLKLGSRRYLVISVAMVAATVEVDAQQTVARGAVAVGACSPVARRLRDLERRLIGHPLDKGIGDVLRPTDLDVLAPIDDVRGSAAYRNVAAFQLVRRALTEVAGE